MTKILIILVVIFVLVVLGVILFVWFFGMALQAAFANKFPFDKYEHLKHIANSDTNLQKQKDEFVRREKEFKIVKNIQDIELYDVKCSINSLIYPNQKYSTLTCPDCGENPFWILGEKLYNEYKTENIQEYRRETKIRYYAICSRCVQIVFYYDESIFDRDVFDRIKKINS
jgi:predicted RNA-binding Zn-ribbon protein involved in translation (DUF1610 family)